MEGGIDTTITRYGAWSLCKEAREGLRRKVMSSKEHKGDTMMNKIFRQL